MKNEKEFDLLTTPGAKMAGRPKKDNLPAERGDYSGHTRRERLRAILRAPAANELTAILLLHTLFRVLLRKRKPSAPSQSLHHAQNEPPFRSERIFPVPD
jgi:hypothetical protein